MSVRPSVRPSVHNQTQWSHMNYSDMNRVRWDKSNDMTFKVIRGQGQGHRAFELTKIAIFKCAPLEAFKIDSRLWGSGRLSWNLEGLYRTRHIQWWRPHWKGAGGHACGECGQREGLDRMHASKKIISSAFIPLLYTCGVLQQQLFAKSDNCMICKCPK